MNTPLETFLSFSLVLSLSLFISGPEVWGYRSIWWLEGRDCVQRFGRSRFLQPPDGPNMAKWFGARCGVDRLTNPGQQSSEGCSFYIPKSCRKPMCKPQIRDGLHKLCTNPSPGDGLLNRAAALGFISSMEPCGETRFVAPTGSLWLGNIIYGYNIAPKCSLLVSENRVPIYFPSLGRPYDSNRFMTCLVIYLGYGKSSEK